MPRIRFPAHLLLDHLQPIIKLACVVVILLVALGVVSDVSVDSPRGPFDWRQRVIILLPGVCAQPADLPAKPDLPTPPLVPQPTQWPTWPDWLTCGGAQAAQDAHARALDTFVGGYGSPAQLTATLNRALQNAPDDGETSQSSIPFSIRAVVAFSYAGDLPTYTSSQTRQPLAVSAQALDAQFRRWQSEYPGASFDLIAHSLGGAVAIDWANSVAAPAERDAIHSIITLDSPLDGYPRSYADNFFLPFFGPVAHDLLAGSAAIQALRDAPQRWISGPGTLASPIVTITNIRDLVVPFFLATIPGAVLAADDYGADSSSLNHGAVLTSRAALAQIAQTLAQPGMPVRNEMGE